MKKACLVALLAYAAGINADARHLAQHSAPATPQKSSHGQNQHSSHSHKAHHAHGAPGSHARPSKEVTKAKHFVNQGPLAPEPELTFGEVIPAPPPGLAVTEVAAPPPTVLVTYQQGALAVSAEDAELREVLEKIGETTGAVIEAPRLQQRLTVHLPPQPPVQVVAALVEGLHLDYALLGGATVADPVRRIILEQRPAAITLSRAAPQNLDATATQARSLEMLHMEQTGGDEGVIENVPARAAARNRQH
jgi:hypothetical protein